MPPSAWSKTYLDFVPPSAGDNTYLDWLSRQITNCYTCFKRGKIVAPYLCLLQSSGYGKTRTLFELAKKNLSSYKVIVWNLKDADSYTNFILLKMVHIGVIKGVENAKQAMIDFLNQWRALASDPSYHNPEQLEHSFKTSAFPRHLEQQLDNIPQVAPSKELEYLLIIDEANALDRVSYSNFKSTSALQLLRKVLSNIDADLGIVCIVADTNSSISNFASKLSKDSADHIRLAPVFYRPIFFLPTVDILASAPAFPFLSYPSLLQFGRPLWFSEYYTNRKPPTVFMLNFAIRKLGFRMYVAKKLHLLSLLFVRVVLHIQSSIAYEMVAHNMATCKWISEDRATCLISHNSEPILAEAAAWYLGKRYLDSALTVLRAALMKADVSLDDLEELITQILLLQAFDSCVKVERPDFLENLLDNSVSVRQFLAKLAPIELPTDDPMLSDDVFVYFSHFTEIDFVPNKETLSKSIARGSALKLKVDETNVDLVIPVFKDRVIFGVLLVQVKDKNKDNYRKSKLEKLYIGKVFGYKSDLCDLNAIGISITLQEQLTKGAEVAQVDLPQPPTKEQIQKRWKAIQPNGPDITQKHLEAQPLNKLKKLLNRGSPNLKTRSNCLAFMNSAPKTCLQNNFILSLPALRDEYSKWIGAECLEKLFDMLEIKNPRSNGSVLAFSAPGSFTHFEKHWQEYDKSLQNC